MGGLVRTSNRASETAESYVVCDVLTKPSSKGVITMNIVLYDSTRWAVIAEWFGADRVVFIGTMFECIDFCR